MQELPTADDVLPLLDGLVRPHEEVDALIHRAAELVRTYTRGAGFAPNGAGLSNDLAEIVTQSVVRSILNPETALSSAAPFEGSPGTFGEWTTSELRVLGVYARRVRSTD